jgi:hypothetical protein
MMEDWTMMMIVDEIEEVEGSDDSIRLYTSCREISEGKEMK